MKWKSCRQNRSRGKILTSLSLLAGLMTTGFQYFSPLLSLVRHCFDFGDRNNCAGLGERSWVRVESRSGVLLPSPPSIPLSTRDVDRFETVPSHTDGRCICMFGFNGRQRLWDFTPSLKCQSSLLLKWECQNKKWHILIMKWGGSGKEGIESNPTIQDLRWHYFLYNCNASRHSINISALLKWFMTQIVEYKILSIDVSSLIFPGASSWKMEEGGDFNKQSLTGVQRKQCAGTDSWQIQYGASKTCDEFAGKVYICGRGELISNINLSAATQCSQAWHE